MRAITERQAEILAFIKAEIATKGYPPTLREIGARFGIRSTNGVNDHLNGLERKGYIRRARGKGADKTPTKSRSITIVDGVSPTLAPSTSPEPTKRSADDDAMVVYAVLDRYGIQATQGPTRTRSDIAREIVATLRRQTRPEVGATA